MSTLLQCDLPLPLYRRGKVRDTYDLGDKLLMVATDRISAFDVVLPSGIPDKGLVLNQLSAFWFQKTAHVIPSHFLQLVDDLRLLKGHVPGHYSALVGRSMLVKKAERLPVECVVRGYLTGSAWEEYVRAGMVQGHPLPQGLGRSDRLNPPLFTPTTKAEEGHDIPLTPEELRDVVGTEIGEQLREKSLGLYAYARDYAQGRGIIIADTKFEFGFRDGELILIDELLTPDSSRFWDLASYSPGKPQDGLDKQPVRDWLIASGWNREPPAPPLPPQIVKDTADRYREISYRLTGERLRKPS